jgi:surfactin synthase thioesterase subunit
MVQTNPAFIVPQPRVKAEIRLFCFPYAGASAYSYQSWLSQFDAKVELVFVQLRGRAERIAEAPHQSMQSLIDELICDLSYFTSCPFLLFGHSLGALICYALCCELKKRQQPLPVHLFASACRAPHVAGQDRHLHLLPQAEFFQAVRQLKGTAEEVLNNQELMALFEPVLKADFKIASCYQAEAVALPVPVTVYYGDQDHSVSTQQLKAWQELTSSGCDWQAMPGDHFFIRHSSDALLNSVRRQLAQFFLQR